MTVNLPATLLPLTFSSPDFLMLYARRHPSPPKRKAEFTCTNGKYKAVPCWTDTAGRIRTWRILSPDGDRLAEVTTKHGARNLIYLLSNPGKIVWGQDKITVPEAAETHAP